MNKNAKSLNGIPRSYSRYQDEARKRFTVDSISCSKTSADFRILVIAENSFFWQIAVFFYNGENERLQSPFILLIILVSFRTLHVTSDKTLSSYAYSCFDYQQQDVFLVLFRAQ